jgi:hypothetical protein
LPTFGEWFHIVKLRSGFLTLEGAKNMAFFATPIVSESLMRFVVAYHLLKLRLEHRVLFRFGLAQHAVNGYAFCQKPGSEKEIHHARHRHGLLRHTPAGSARG